MTQLAVRCVVERRSAFVFGALKSKLNPIGFVLFHGTSRIQHADLYDARQTTETQAIHCQICLHT